MRSHTIRRDFAAVLLLLGPLLLSTVAAAQTALIDTPLFHLNDDGSLVSLGTFGTGSIPATGAGARLMWHPAKAAFRAGTVNGTQWDEANIGAYSVAMGSRTTASGEFATALGRSTMASGNDATALGAMTTASGVQSTAMGGGTMAMGNYATAMGRNTTAGGLFSVAMGESTTATGTAATAMGESTEASGAWSTAMGRNTTASGSRSTAMGESTTASGNFSVAMGYDTEASGSRSTAMGESTTASGLNATAMGYDTEASGSRSTAMGGGTIASGLNATAMGSFSTAQAYVSLVLGRLNIVAGNPGAWVSTDPVLVVGNGSSTGSRSNAFTLLKNGNLTIAGTLTQNSDRRLKRDIQPLTDALDGLARLQPVRYRFRAGTNRPEGVHIGLIAQEVQAVFPELAQEGADGYLSVSYTNLVAVLVQALNEQQNEIEAQQDEIDVLKEQQNEIEALHDRLARLEILLARAGTETATDR